MKNNGAAKRDVKAAWRKFEMVAQICGPSSKSYYRALQAARAVEATTGLTMMPNGSVR